MESMKRVVQRYRRKGERLRQEVRVPSRERRRVPSRARRSDSPVRLVFKPDSALSQNLPDMRSSSKIATRIFEDPTRRSMWTFTNTNTISMLTTRDRCEKGEFQRLLIQVRGDRPTRQDSDISRFKANENFRIYFLKAGI